MSDQDPGPETQVGEQACTPVQPVLRMSRISKSFPGVQALSDVGIDLRPGEILAICGENGAGKSTLMKILSGSYPAGEYEGEIQIAGRPAIFHSTRDAKHAGIEMIYQEISLHLDLSVAENILLGNLPATRLGTVDWGRAQQQAREALALVNLAIDPRTLVRRLSTSQQQLIAIARALMRQPSILVLDEPTSALTETETENLLSILAGLREKGISCIYISHKLEEVFAIADRVAVLRDGHLISTYERAQFEKGRVIEDMVGRKIETFFPKVRALVGEEVLRVENLTIPHPLTRQKKILDGISFSLHAGEILGIAGLVGSGRSELLNALFGELTRGVTGRIVVGGKPVTVHDPRLAKATGMGLLTESRKRSGLVGTMNIAGNVSLASLRLIRHGLFLSGRGEAALAEEYRASLSIRTPSIRTNVLKLSGGNQQKVVLAKWLATRPRILLLDEPTKGIDVGAKVDIYNLMNELTQAGVAIILVTSEMPELIAMSDRLIVLSNGQIQAEFEGGDVTQEEIMAAITHG